ncbi:hypothetical protein SISSUDRAFT_255258 [Sistotremastrum suecicum HHB10207 ss-3]|uniref:Uncharacterized protein n=1 Tax=Sistotremastrum suecicum HHB10207 ss-3 TaxID=1314776 RepID=A0A165ZUI6_9AGAM|nr:hypothetical protein SISSUDRAFT_255258 [Sistotremastrum suecicum HHB10207 ss-3]
MPVLALTRPPVPLIHYTSPSPIHSTSAYSASSHPTLTPELRAHLIKSNKKVEQVLGVTPHLVSRPISSKSKSCDTPRPLPIGKASEEQGKEGKGAHKRTKSDECRKEGGMRKRRHTLFGSKSSSSSSDDSAVPPVPPMPSLPAVLNIGSNANASSSTTSLLRIESTTSSNTSSSSSTPPSSAGAGDILRQPPPRRSSHRHRPPPLNLKENTQPAPSSHVRSASSPVPVSASKEKDGALSPPLSSSLPNSPFLPSTPLSPAPENVISETIDEAC